jgi:hypothetical protein
MRSKQTIAAWRTRRFAALAAAMLCTLVATQARADETSGKNVVGRINFDDANLPPANVEIDLSQGMFADLFGIGDAAIEGIAATLAESSKGSPEATRVAAEQLQAARQILDMASAVVHEIRVRGYEESPEGALPYFDSKLNDKDWETVVRARKGDENVRVALLRSDGAVRGVFVIAAKDKGLFIANAVCDISPENVKKLASAATRIGLENGLGQALEAKMQHMKHRLPPPPPQVDQAENK